MVTNSASALSELLQHALHAVIHAGAQWLAHLFHPPVLQATC